MPTIAEVLRRDPEPLPVWLASKSPPNFDRETFFGSRTVYYPGSYDDWHPVKFCSISHSAHCFIYVDQEFSCKTIPSKILKDRKHGLKGYAITHDERISTDALRLGGWTRSVTADEGGDAPCYRNGLEEPFLWFVALDRQGDGEGGGPQRLAILFIGGDGFASYDALYCQTDGTLPPFLAVIQDHGFGGNFDSFGQHGLLERIARKSSVLPKYLLVAKNSKPWGGYSDTQATAEPGGSAAHPRSLFRRDPH